MNTDNVFRHVDGLRFTRLEEVESLLLFAPRSREMVWLNLSSWIILELATDRTRDEVVREYAQLTGAEDAPAHVDAGIQQLLELGALCASPRENNSNPIEREN